MTYVEVIVNRPIRRTFHQTQDVPTAPDPLTDVAAFDDPLVDVGLHGNVEEKRAALQLFHYHLPVELEAVVQPGHLVWVPFGTQEVQGFIVNRTASSPVPTRAVLRLARPEPVLTSAQMTLAAWIADYYVAPLSEAVKLFLPPGLLSKEDGSSTARAKRELRIRLVLEPEEALGRLWELGRKTQQVRVLQWLLQQSDADNSSPLFSVETVQRACQLKTTATLKTLARQGLLTIDECIDESALSDTQVKKTDFVRLALSHAATTEAVLELSGASKYRPVLEVLIAVDGPIWKGDLYDQVSADLQMLRDLHGAGFIAMHEEIRFRDPLAGRTYARTQPPPFTPEQHAVWQQIWETGFQDNTAADTLVKEHIAEEGTDEEPAATSAFVKEERPDIPLFDFDEEVTNEEVTNESDRNTACAAKFLLHGVTGSGKTEIYLRAIDEALRQEKQAIVLVPEIALTPQTVSRFAGRFPGRVTVIHSALSAGERYDVWRHLRAGEFDVVVGPRSALFAPFSRLGLIILDEEHESSYKQNAEAWGSFTVFYDARVVAERLAELTGSVLIYGSATPSLERYTAAQQGKLTLLEMLHRVMGHRSDLAADLRSDISGESTPQVPAQARPSQYVELPPVEIVDMRQELRVGHRSILSRALLSELHATLDAGEQAILFLNRRGTRTFVMCRDCGSVQECTRCDVPLTFHEKTDVLICHHCNRRFPIPDVCPECESKRIKYFGSGTQRLEEVLQQIAPHAKLMRWDADTVSGKGSHEEILRRFADHEADVLVGTQMIAKGLDFPLVTLVGVVAADVGLYLPDFRSGERTFQLLTQVAGRAGRSERGGRVVIQSYKPEHYAIQAAANHDYHAFYHREIGFRQEHGYPPIRTMARLIYWDKKLEKAQAASVAMVDSIRHRLLQLGLEGEAAMVLGPAPAFFARYRGYYRWQVILRAPHPAQILRGLTIPFGWRVDIDPVSML